MNFSLTFFSFWLVNRAAKRKQLNRQNLLLIAVVGALTPTVSSATERAAVPALPASSVTGEAFSAQLAAAEEFLRQSKIESIRLQADETKKTLILDLGKTAVTDLTPLARFTALRELDLSETKVSDLKPLAALIELNRLSLRGTRVNDITPLENLRRLQQLDLSATHVSDVKPLAGLTALKRLRLHKTTVADIKPLAGLMELTALNLYQTLVSDLRPLEGLKSLKILNLGETKVDPLQLEAFLKRHPEIRLLVTDPAMY